MHVGLRMSTGRMVGRDGELGRLLTLLDDAEAGRSVAALVSGDAGVGKTRLIAEVTRLAAGRGFTVLSGQCAELGDSVPYLPLADALRGAAQSTGVRDALSSRPAPEPAAARGRGRAGRRLGPVGPGPAADARRCPRPARRAGRGRGARPARAGGPALGRCFDQGPGHLPVPDAAPGTSRPDRHATGPTTCTGVIRSGRWWRSCCGCPASPRSTLPRWSPRPWPSTCGAAARAASTPPS